MMEAIRTAVRIYGLDNITWDTVWEDIFPAWQIVRDEHRYHALRKYYGPIDGNRVRADQLFA